MSSGTPISDDDLHALADGRLTEPRAAEVSAHLEESPADASRVAFYRRLNSDLHGLFDPVLSEPVPGSLLAAGYGRKRTWPLQAAAAAVLLAVGVGGGWFAHQHGVAGIAAIAFTENAPRPSGHVRKCAIPWRSRRRKAIICRNGCRRLQNNVSIPDLGKVGYEFLAGGCRAGNGVAAADVEEQRRQPVTLTTHGGDTDTAPMQADGLSVPLRDTNFTMRWRRNCRARSC
jgi:anti-sigma factor RsiW